MEIITKIKSWSAALADVGVSLIALGIVLEVYLVDKMYHSGLTLVLSVMYNQLLQDSLLKV